MDDRGTKEAPGPDLLGEADEARRLTRLRRMAKSIARAVYGRRKELALISTIGVTIAAYALAYVIRFEMRWPVESVESRPEGSTRGSAEAPRACRRR